MRAVNLIPAEQQRGTAIGAGRSQGAAYAVLGVLGVLAIFAWLYGSAHRQVSSDKAEVASLTARSQQAQANAERLAPYTSFIALRDERKQAVSQLVDTRFDWAHAFHELGRVLPRDASIDSLEGKVGSSTTTGATSAPGGSSTSAGASGKAASTAVTSATPIGSVPTFTLKGCATSQAAVARTLDRLRLIQGVSEVTLQSSTKSSSTGSSGGCTAGHPAFSVVISFDPLPAVPTTGSSGVKTVTSTGGTG
jgi:Tfp pilus assembly protein PilN